MKKNKLLFFIISFLLIVISITEYGCKHEPVIPTDSQDTCDLENIGFVSTVEPVLKNNCYGCHSSITPNGGIDLTDFNVLAELVVNGKLSGVINRKTGYSPMPPGFAMDDCTVTQIDRWIADTAATIIGGCDTLSVTYTETVYPILQANCIGCHSGASPAGGLDFTNYEQLAVVAQNGALMGSIQHASGFSPMPKNGNKLSDCKIKEIEIWIANGTPNN